MCVVTRARREDGEEKLAVSKKNKNPTYDLGNNIKLMINKKRLRQVWYGGPQCPRHTSKFKDNSSEAKLPKKNEVPKDEIQMRGR